jgi:CheY-like chemotaxis protein
MRGRGQQGVVEITTSHGTGMVNLYVADDGPGIAPAARARLFEAFFTTKGPDEGTGLGLAISRGIAREHMGDLVCEDRADGKTGAQFILRLPVSDHPIAPPPADRVIPEGVPARVLVVDDEAAVRDALVTQLGRLGAHVDSAGTPAEAERLLGSGSTYDAVLMDVRLPGRSGLEVHRALREVNPELAGRVVFMTGDLVNDDVIRTVKATGNPLLEKPFTTDELRLALSRTHEPTP